MADLREIVQLIIVDYLQRLKIRSVIDNQKTKGFGITDVSQPSADGHLRIHILLRLLI